MSFQKFMTTKMEERNVSFGDHLVLLREVFAVLIRLKKIRFRGFSNETNHDIPAFQGPQHHPTYLLLIIFKGETNGLG